MSFNKSLSLEDDGKKYDQFKNKKSTYKESDYTTEIDQTKITAQMRREAQQLEDDILNRGGAQSKDQGHDDNDAQIE